MAPLAAFGSDYVFQCTSAMNGESGVTNADPANAIRRVDQLYTKLEQARQRIVKYKTFYVEDCDTLLIAYGGSARAARVVTEELRAEGKKVGLFQLITAWPFPGAEIADCVRSGVKAVYVPEMNHDGQVAGEIRKYVANRDLIRQINKFNGEILTPEDIYEAMRRQQ